MKVLKLKDVAIITTGRTPSKAVKGYYANGTIPFVKPPNLDKAEVVNATTEYITESGSKFANIIPKNSVMVSCIGILGKVGIAGRSVATNQQINSLTFNEDLVHYKYGYYYVLTLGEKLKSISNAGVVPIVNKSSFSNIEMAVPSLDKQLQIVEILDKTSSLRRTRIKSIELIDKYMESLFIDMFGSPVSNQMKWSTKKFDELGALDRGKSKHRPRNAPELLGGEHPLIQTGDVAKANTYIESFTSTYSDIGLKQSKKWPKGTLCITIAANIAKTGILKFDACFPDSVVGFTADTSKTNSVFIHYWMSFFQKILEANAPESAQKNINLRILRELEVICPPIELQNKFQIAIKEAETIKNNMLLQKRELDNQFKALMQTAFKGSLRN